MGVLQLSHYEENTPAPSQGPCVSLDSLGFPENFLGIAYNFLGILWISESVFLYAVSLDSKLIVIVGSS